MQQIVCFFVAAFLFVSASVTSSVSMAAGASRRAAKQNLNLIGRELVCHMDKSEQGEILIEEDAFFKTVQELYYNGTIPGCIFIYQNKMNVMKQEEDQLVRLQISTAGMEERNKINIVNQMVLFIAPELLSPISVNIAEHSSDDYLTEELFSYLPENAVFLIAEAQGKLFVSGFSVC